jgi:hypothetical protein
MKGEVYKYEAVVTIEMMGIPENIRSTSFRNFSILVA